MRRKKPLSPHILLSEISSRIQNPKIKPETEEKTVKNGERVEKQRRRMSCKRHPCEQGGGIGICASCLREKLFDLIAAQAKETSESAEDRPKFGTPPLDFPRSISPYICTQSARTDIVGDTWHHHQPRFYSTPQVGPAFSQKKKNQSGFSTISSLFGVRSERNDKVSDSLSSSSWFSTLIGRGGKKKPLFLSLGEVSGTGLRGSCPVIDRGMSPVDREEKEEEDDEESPTVDGHVSESPIVWRKSMPVQARRSVTRQIRNVSGLAFCLSPLVRVCPNKRGCGKPEVGFPCDVARGSKQKPHLAMAASFCANRSRKLADFGRYP
eukprot:TRINITY_DN1634_c0_g1_i1.p1 TRINITY_DN1634_c0_g1~~TRINITY_DN1634_c0_g1_i1.p1  ORF type:complete len:323 (-),score=8.93 TRINITY_DN1634_c0_g1_i1:336-1304(-)